MKKYLLLLVLLFSFNLLPQFQLQWTSPDFSYSKLSGWMDFEKQGDKWLKRLYTIDSTRFDVMQSGYSGTPQYSYIFTAPEILAGAQLYSLGEDLNGNGFVDAYILAYNGISTNYRQSVKIVDIASGAILFEKNDQNFYYSYPSLSDINDDGLLELILVKYEYPLFANFYYEVYSTGITGNKDQLVEYSFNLKQNYPNPFNPETKIEFDLAEASLVKLEIFDVNGEKVKTLVNGDLPSGIQSIRWDGSNNLGNRVPTGVYMYTLTSGGKSSTKKMIVLK
ncbi:MAG: T9SS type A sorting domain-containing protein [Ignavibacteriales bacterium]|nr:T9SS type A sorting domain-containing protein [Ignavibacteriales bacterium]